MKWSDDTPLKLRAGRVPILLETVTFISVYSYGLSDQHKDGNSVLSVIHLHS